MPDPSTDGPEVVLGELADDSVAITIFVLVRHAAAARPRLAAGLSASVLLDFHETYPPVRIDFRGHVIVVGDDLDGADRASDLVISGRMGDVSALMTAPLAGGLPKPTSSRGRAALARLADGRVELDGPLRLGRKVLKLLAVDAEPAPREVPPPARPLWG